MQHLRISSADALTWAITQAVKYPAVDVGLFVARDSLLRDAQLRLQQHCERSGMPYSASRVHRRFDLLENGCRIGGFSLYSISSVPRYCSQVFADILVVDAGALANDPETLSNAERVMRIRLRYKKPSGEPNFYAETDGLPH